VDRALLAVVLVANDTYLLSRVSGPRPVSRRAAMVGRCSNTGEKCSRSPYRGESARRDPALRGVFRSPKCMARSEGIEALR
jgi:hypothetical protein